jgi:CRISPR-associated protein Cas6
MRFGATASDHRRPGIAEADTEGIHFGSSTWRRPSVCKVGSILIGKLQQWHRGSLSTNAFMVNDLHPAMHVDLAFTVSAQRSISVDHGYAVYGAVSRLLPDVHRENGVAIHPLRGRQFGDGLLMLMPWSTLTLRLPADQIPSVLPLAGKSLQIGETSLRIGVPQVYALEPASALRSRLVVIKVAHIDPGQVTEKQFAAAARKQLDSLDINAEIKLTLGKRRTLRIKDAEIVGYELIAEGLTAEESLTLQEHGLGGRHHMGCGVFAPLVGETVRDRK